MISSKSIYEWRKTLRKHKNTNKLFCLWNLQINCSRSKQYGRGVELQSFIAILFKIKSNLTFWIRNPTKETLKVTHSRSKGRSLSSLYTTSSIPNYPVATEISIPPPYTPNWRQLPNEGFVTLINYKLLNSLTQFSALTR